MRATTTAVLRTPPTLVLATGNSDKADEMRAWLRPYGFLLKTLADLGLESPDETASSFEAIAESKARHATERSGLPSLADDSGVCVDALCGAPGIHTADWATSSEGTRDFSRVVERIERELANLMVSPSQPNTRRASWCTALALAWPIPTPRTPPSTSGANTIEVISTLGRTPGQLVTPPEGPTRDSLHPVFMPDGFASTYARLDPPLRLRIDARAQAFRQLHPRLGQLAKGE